MKSGVINKPLPENVAVTISNYSKLILNLQIVFPDMEKKIANFLLLPHFHNYETRVSDRLEPKTNLGTKFWGSVSFVRMKSPKLKSHNEKVIIRKVLTKLPKTKSHMDLANKNKVMTKSPNKIVLSTKY